MIYSHRIWISECFSFSFNLVLHSLDFARLLSEFFSSYIKQHFFVMQHKKFAECDKNGKIVFESTYSFRLP